MRKILLLLLLGIAPGAYAQLTMALQVPPVGVVQKTQLWNMVLVNGSSAAMAIEVNITMLNTADNTPVITASSKSVSLQKGANQLKYTDFSPVTWKYLSAAFSGDMNPEGFISVGTYTVCYTVSTWQGDGYATLTEDCINLEIQPLSPPVLNTPADKDTLLTQYPQFTWLPPAPLNLFTNLSYDIVVTGILPGQSPLQALQQNLPLYSSAGLTTPVSMYPASATALDTAKWYAWGVVAKNNNQTVAQSEVWTFYVPSVQSTLQPAAARSYLMLRKVQEASGTMNVTTDGLGVSFYSYDKEHNAILTVTTADGKVVKELNQTVAYGNNFWWYTLGNQFEKNTLYRVSLQDTRGNTFTATFSIQ